MLSTHVLDLTAGKPASGLEVRLYRIAPDGRTEIARGETDADGRIAAPFGGRLEAGVYELLFYTGSAFFAQIPVRFTIASAETKYHIPLLLSPYGYSTYRGS